ncbi:ribosomal protein L4 [Ophiocordyceps camponoti-floridani]|uniref:Large ribosomal subunit protein uL4m n=1 Tax=Ophiocordyceps camponoti-floridani TaxID=2030778 RepID=A0A8H4QED5_9HYPO|nr:ribosomal protein L4 [Ophiocordyceps camponoti-floridani]
MASRGPCRPRGVLEALRRCASQSGLARGQPFSRSNATQAAVPETTPVIQSKNVLLGKYQPISTVPLTIHRFPSLEPVSLERWSVQHLYLPLRRDLLHLAVVYEGDSTRQGTASSKTRYEVRGSHRKPWRQKGTGRARAGTTQSPLWRGGGKTFGPHPRDFSTKLNRKVYDKAWRTALSYRYRKGQLVVCEDGMELALPSDFTMLADKFLKDGLRGSYLQKYMTGVLHTMGLGRPSGRTLFVTADHRPWLYEAMSNVPRQGRVLPVDDVDVKDLLETGNVVMERSVLRTLIEQHQSDLNSDIYIHGERRIGPPLGERILGI